MPTVDDELRALLAAELCAIMDGWTQIDAAMMLRIHQPMVSRLRNGRLRGMSVGWLLGLIARRRFDIEVRLSAFPPHAGRRGPLVTVTRTDMFGMPVAKRPVERGRQFRSSGGHVAGEFASDDSW